MECKYSEEITVICRINAKFTEPLKWLKRQFSFEPSLSGQEVGLRGKWLNLVLPSFDLVTSN